MLEPGSAKLLSVYINEGDKWHHQPLFLALLDHARRAGLAGVTLLHTEGGVGSHGQIHDTMSDYLMVSMPIVVQIVDTAEAIAAFMPTVQQMVPEGLITLADVEVVGRGRPALAPANARTVRGALAPGGATVAPGTPIKELAERLMTAGTPYLYVVDGDGRVVGVVGKRDLLQQVLSPHPSFLALFTDRLPGLGSGDLHKRLEQAHAFTAEQLMTAPVASVGPDAPLAEAVRLMLERGFLAVPVLEEGRLVGLVTQEGVLKQQLGRRQGESS